MGLFDKLIKKKDDAFTICAPADGNCIALSEVKDPTFAEEILGKGVAIIPQNNRIVAPADGTISMVFPTGHAFTMETNSGAEVLVHIGIDTVKLQGKYFSKFVSDGEQVKKGDLIIEVELEKLKEDGFDTTIPIVICNSDDFKTIEGTVSGPVISQQDIIKIEKMN